MRHTYITSNYETFPDRGLSAGYHRTGPMLIRCHDHRSSILFYFALSSISRAMRRKASW
jgi:hypothetical protein